MYVYKSQKIFKYYYQSNKDKGRNIYLQMQWEQKILQNIILNSHHLYIEGMAIFNKYPTTLIEKKQFLLDIKKPWP